MSLPSTCTLLKSKASSISPSTTFSPSPSSLHTSSRRSQDGRTPSSSVQMQVVPSGKLWFVSFRRQLMGSATALADQLNLDFALINRKRKRDLPAYVPTVPPTPSGSDSGSVHEEEEGAIVEKMELLVGDVRGKVAILVDDMVDTGHTVRLAAGVLQDAGAKEVYALISHGQLSRTECSGIRTD